MAQCHCGRDAGYLHSVCPSCKKYQAADSAPATRQNSKSKDQLILRGKQGKTLFVAGDSIRIEKVGGFFAEKREKTLPIRQITSVEVKKPSTFVGFIQFSIPGGKVNDSSYTVTGGAFNAVSDENSVTFLGDADYQVALAVKSYVEEWSAKQSTNSTLPPPLPNQAQSIADEILKFAELMDRGLLTREEFDAKKRQLLGS